jgi:hypothetical protein
MKIFKLEWLNETIYIIKSLAKNKKELFTNVL